MIRRYQHLPFYRADCHFKGRVFTSVMLTKHEAWRALIEIVAIEAKK